MKILQFSLLVLVLGCTPVPIPKYNVGDVVVLNTGQVTMVKRNCYWDGDILYLLEHADESHSLDWYKGIEILGRSKYHQTEIIEMIK